MIAVARRPERTPLGELDAALAIAARTEGLTFIATPVPVVAPAAIVATWPDAPLVAWSSPDGLAIVGVGVAVELRGSGPDRWARVAHAARSVRVGGAVVLGANGLTAHETLDPTARDANGSTHDGFVATVRDSIHSIHSLGFARPRFLGGAAFAPGAADAMPWTGFGDAWFVLPRWAYVHDGASAWLVLAVDASSARDISRWHAELGAFRRALTREAPVANRATTSNGLPASASAIAADSGRIATTTESLELWRAQVEAITSAISNGACSKIVAARTCAVALETITNRSVRATTMRDDAAIVATAARDDATIAHTARVLATLEMRHPECFRVLVRPPGGGTLVAATPERLVRLDGDEIRCDALAGTVRLDSPDAEARLLASDKDRREHALVVDAIRDALAELGTRVDAPTAPAIKTLRHVLHLHTPIRATVPRASHGLHLLELAARLHPTPAVGGTPTTFAVEWIREHEPVPRGWYASPVGWFDLEGNGELAVAIRSGVLAGDRAHLWAGAGIVAGSDPDRELAETELKLRAMLGALCDGGAR